MREAERLRAAVEERAARRCEYCGLAQEGQEATFHVDHIQPRISGGATALENLALACVSCSLRKGARQTLTDPITGLTFPMFNPRTQRWSDHLRWAGTIVEPVSPLGSALIDALALNRTVIVLIRLEEAFRGRHPPHAM